MCWDMLSGQIDNSDFFNSSISPLRWPMKSHICELCISWWALWKGFNCSSMPIGDITMNPYGAWQIEFTQWTLSSLNPTVNASTSLGKCEINQKSPWWRFIKWPLRIDIMRWTLMYSHRPTAVLHSKNTEYTECVI